VQVNSLGLTEQQPENNVYRILLEMLAVVLSKNARARAVQLPAWNEALGLPRPVGPAMVAAHAADRGLRDRPSGIRRHLRRLAEIAAKVEALKAEAREELARIDDMGGAVAAVESAT
jgi:(2R)-ethylmalonyl-CoA mutase